jgi:hypothetical protein
LVIITKKLVIDSPKIWSLIVVTKKLVIDSPKNWSSSLKNWSLIRQKIGH